MSHIVDDAGNLHQFTAAVTNVLASFSQRKNYGHPARGETQSPTASIVQAQPSIGPDMNANAYMPGSPSITSPPHTAKGARDASSASLPSREVNQATSRVTNSFPLLSRHNDQKPDGNEAHFKSMDNGTSVKPETAINKHLDSPQLTGLRAPPPTPETWAHRMPPTGLHNENRLGDDPLEEELAKEDLLMGHIEKHMTNKPTHIGLGDNMYARRRSSYLVNEIGHTQYTFSGRDVSPTSRREREKSFERLSFVVASASKAELLSKISAQSMIKSGTYTLRQAVASTETLDYSKDVTQEPIQLRVTAPSTERHQTTKDQQAKRQIEKLTAAPPSEIEQGGQPVKMKHAHTTLEAIRPVLAPKPAPGSPTKDERAHVNSEKFQAVPSQIAVPDQHATGERVQKNPGNAVAEPPIVAFKAGLQTFLDKYGAQIKAATLQIDPIPLEWTAITKLKQPRSAIPAEMNEAAIESSSRKIGSSAIASDLVLLQRPKSTIESNPVISGKPNLPSKPKINSRVSEKREDRGLQAYPINASGLRPSTPLRAIAVSQKDILSTGKFEDLSPPTARHILRPNTKNSYADKLQANDDTFTTYWGRYPQPERRDKPEVACVRRAVISGLPVPCSTNFVASLVYGGLVEHIAMKSSGTAEVLFVKPDDCSRFCDDNKNGLVYGKEVYECDKARELFVLVQAHTDVDVVGGKVAEMILRGVTRCVRAVWADSDYTTNDLWKLAEGKVRKVEHIVDDTKTVEIDTDGKKAKKECRVVTFRFCKMQDADSFHASLRKDMDWEHCNITFAPDPCATAKGIYLQG